MGAVYGEGLGGDVGIIRSKFSTLAVIRILNTNPVAPPAQKTKIGFHIATHLSPYTAPMPRLTATPQDMTMEHTLESGAMTIGGLGAVWSGVVCFCAALVE